MTDYVNCVCVLYTLVSYHMILIEVLIDTLLLLVFSVPMTHPGEQSFFVLNVLKVKTSFII